MRDSIVVIGVGNVLLGDDGVGPCVVRLLEERLGHVDDVEIVDCGTAGLDVSGAVLDREVVIFVDAIDAPGDPGTIVRLEGDAIRSGGATGPRVSPHEPGIRDSLALAELVDRAPSTVVLIGVVPENTEMGTALTPAVADAVGPAANAVVTELERLGRPVSSIREARVAGFFGAAAEVAS